MNHMRKLFLVLAAAGCTDDRAPITETQSLSIELIAPTDLGTVDRRLSDDQRQVVVSLTAKTPDNRIDTAFNGPVRVYAQFLGTLTPGLDASPLAVIEVVDGVATNQTITLPKVFGPTTLWIDNGSGIGPSYEFGAVTGTSPTLWFREPFIVDLQTPRSETALDALQLSPLQDKQVGVNASRYGARGRMVVTSTYSQGFTISDVACADEAGTPPCFAGPYDHILIYSFSVPRNQFGEVIQVGDVVQEFTGGQSEFNGLTEIGFPRVATVDTPNDPRRLPTPVVINPTAGTDTTWFGPLSNPDGVINWERNESAAVEIRNPLVCPLDDDYATYKQWKLDPSAAGDKCNSRSVINIITSGTDFTVDPETLVGRRLTSVTGIVRPVSIGSFNVWIVYPRGSADMKL